MPNFTTEQALALSNEGLASAIDELVTRFDDIEDDTAELLTALVAKKKSGNLNGDEAFKALQSVMILLQKARKYKASMELIVGAGSKAEVDAARKEVREAIKNNKTN